MIYWDLFLAFFIPGIVGYGGGPPSIPLVEAEVVERYGWLTTEQFADIVAMGNALPGPIATKMAGYIGYEVAGPMGATVALFATVAPSLLAMIFLVTLLYRFKDSPQVKKMTAYIRPTIAVLLGVLAFDFLFVTWGATNTVQTVLIGGVGYLLLEKLKVHPALVIVASLLYGALFLA
jgi:chromate transporter